MFVSVLCHFAVDSAAVPAASVVLEDVIPGVTASVMTVPLVIVLVGVISAHIGVYRLSNLHPSDHLFENVWC